MSSAGTADPCLAVRRQYFDIQKRAELLFAGSGSDPLGIVDRQLFELMNKHWHCFR